MRLLTASKCLRRHGKPSASMIGLVGLLCCSLVAMGALFWVGNSWALVFDHDPKTTVNIGAFLDDSVDAADCSGLNNGAGMKPDLDEDGVIPIAGGYLVRGNGDRDDNKGEEFKISRRCSGKVQAEITAAVSNFGERRTVVAYKDFGHLKVMPAADGQFQNHLREFFASAKGLPCITGGLFYFRSKYFRMVFF